MIEGFPDVGLLAAGSLVLGTVAVVIVRISVSLKLRYSRRWEREPPKGNGYRVTPALSVGALYVEALCESCGDVRTHLILGTEKPNPRVRIFEAGCITCDAVAIVGAVYKLHGQMAPLSVRRLGTGSLEIEVDVWAERLSARMPPEFGHMRDEIADAIRDGYRDPDKDEGRWTAKQERELRRMWLKSLRQRVLAFLPGRRRA